MKGMHGMMGGMDEMDEASDAAKLAVLDEIRDLMHQLDANQLAEAKPAPEGNEGGASDPDVAKLKALAK